MTVEGVRTRASTNEALVTLAVPLEQASLVASFMSKIGRQVGAAFADVESQASGSKGNVPVSTSNEARVQPVLSADKEKRPYGMEAKDLKLSGFFRRPDVWKAIGTDEQFRRWIREQPSAWSGEFDHDPNMEAAPSCEAAHVSRIEYGRGIGHKPEYACIPLLHAEHMQQHAIGESYFDRHDDVTGQFESGRDWMERMRIHYVSAWAWQMLKEELGFESMADIPPPTIARWALQHGLQDFLPQIFQPWVSE